MDRSICCFLVKAYRHKFRFFQVLSKEDSQKEVHTRFCQALSLGGDILDQAYERLEVSDSDSDGESGDR